MAMAMSFSVLQYNTLADVLSDAFPLVAPQWLGWEHRQTALVNDMLLSSPDVICLEEVDHFDDWFRPQLDAHGYDGRFLRKATGPGEPPARDGCALFYRRSKFTLQSSSELRYREHMPGGPAQVALAVVLRLAETEQRVCVAVTHLKAKHTNEAVRLQEAGILARHLVELRAGSRTPVVLAGDLNTEPSGPVYAMLQTGEGKLDQMHENYDHNALPLQSAYATGGAEPAYTTWKIRPPLEQARTIDYLFFSSDVLKVVDLRPIPSPEDIPHPRLPNERHPSDHLPLQATFALL